MKWVYESDGDVGRRTHYVVNEDGTERICDFHDARTARRAVLAWNSHNLLVMTLRDLITAFDGYDTDDGASPSAVSALRRARIVMDQIKD